MIWQVSRDWRKEEYQENDIISSSFLVHLLHVMDWNVSLTFPVAPLFTVILSLVGKFTCYALGQFVGKTKIQFLPNIQSMACKNTFFSCDQTKDPTFLRRSQDPKLCNTVWKLHKEGA